VPVEIAEDLAEIEVAWSGFRWEHVPKNLPHGSTGTDLQFDWTKYDARLAKYLDGSAFTEQYGYNGPGYEVPAILSSMHRNAPNASAERMR